MSDLYTRTMNLLQRDPRPLREIADGAEVNLHWLSKFKQGKFANPGVRTIERLHGFLSKNESKNLQAKALRDIRSLRKGLKTLNRKAAA